MDCSVDFDNGIVTLPFFVGCLYCLWEPTWLFNTHPSARISRSISFDVIGICVLLAHIVYQNTRAYTIRNIVKRVNKKKEINPSLKCKVYM